MCIRDRSHTIRKDWRTREGSLEFLSRNWYFFRESFNKRPVIFWYCANFEALESILSHRKFVMFLYKNWSQYGNFVSSKECVSFLRIHSKAALECIKNKSLTAPDFPNTPISARFVEILDHFHQRKTEMVTRAAEKKTLEIHESVVPTQTPVQATDSIVIENSFPDPEAEEFFHFEDSCPSEPTYDCVQTDQFSLDYDPYYESALVDDFIC